MTELRANLRAMLERVKSGETLVVTERGRPIARLGPPGADERFAELVAAGRITPPTAPKRSLGDLGLPLELGVAAGPTLSDHVIENR